MVFITNNSKNKVQLETLKAVGTGSRLSCTYLTVLGNTYIFFSPESILISFYQRKIHLLSREGQGVKSMSPPEPINSAIYWV